jgi:hypothetical protein
MSAKIPEAGPSLILIWLPLAHVLPFFLRLLPLFLSDESLYFHVLTKSLFLLVKEELQSYYCYHVFKSGWRGRPL